MNNAFTFAPATREQARARIALEGPSGSGKTYTSLTLATAMGERIALIDTERGSASKYARGKAGNGFVFETLQMTKFDPRDLPKALAAAAAAKFDVVIVDSLSHFWMGQGGMLELVDAIGKRNGGNFGGWKDARPYERAMIDALLGYPGHVIVTMRQKSEWVIEENERGKKSPRKVGTKAEQREGIEFEFDVVGDLDQENTLVVSKSRCPELSGAVINRPGADMAASILEWLADGTAAPDAAQFLDELCADDITYAKALELHQRAERALLLGAAVLHPITSVPTTLGEVIVERGRSLKTAEQAAARAAIQEKQEQESAPSREQAGEAATAQQQTPAAGDSPVTSPQMRMMHAQFNTLGFTDRDDRLRATSLIVGRNVPTANDLTQREAAGLLDVLNSYDDPTKFVEMLDRLVTDAPAADAA